MKIKTTSNPSVDKYLMDGCMRCKYGGTPQCKVNDWKKELELLRQIVLETGLTEEIKWGVPVYTANGKNIVTVNALKKSANIGFFKGVLLADTHKILQQQGNLQSARLVKFTTTQEIEESQKILKDYIQEAIGIERSAFYALTPGRQRGYVIYFSQAKQAQTRMNRIKKYKQQNI
ncbi:uncharacterized protein YdeI-like [Penaeus monodon]|uniref:uncharacterized protein YdeI-like n=1 Tax=Penaeus monodon TaxID=6687 RepID=UPI0018A77EA1|nr:uncharacterized protein YdeI-like [Penaeus monodon]